MQTIELAIRMPELLYDSFLLHSDTFPDGGRGLSSQQINMNSRVRDYNGVLEGIGHKKGSPVWLKSTIPLDVATCSNKFERKKFKWCKKTQCLVLALDLLIEGSNYLEEEETFEDVLETLEDSETGLNL